MTHPPENPDGSNRGIAGLTRNERIALIFFFILTLGYAGWQLISRKPVEVELGEDITGGMVVQVEGAVVSPGLVFLPEGARVSDAIDAAGGFTSDADRESVNLAEKLEDGQRVDVPYLNRQSDSGSSNSGGNSGSTFRRMNYPVQGGNGSGENDSPNTAGLVNINEANQYELQTLPGIGEALALRIIEYRVVHGAFEKVEDIMQVEGIGDGKFEDIHELITVED